jgi:hypothetical protein
MSCKQHSHPTKNLASNLLKICLFFSTGLFGGGGQYAELYYVVSNQGSLTEGEGSVRLTSLY